jgi:hypothetical protein
VLDESYVIPVNIVGECPEDERAIILELLRNSVDDGECNG